MHSNDLPLKVILCIYLQKNIVKIAKEPTHTSIISFTSYDKRQGNTSVGLQFAVLLITIATSISFILFMV